MIEEDTALENMKKTAFHEAGHVFLYEVFGILYKSVQINEDAQVGEQEGVVHGDEEASIEIDELIYACICFSGAVAQDRYTYPSCPPEHYGVSLQEGVGVNGSDFDKYKKIRLPENHFLPLLDTTRKVIVDNDHWELISKIANALIEKKQLQSEEVKQILGGSNLNRDIVEWVLPHNSSSPKTFMLSQQLEDKSQHLETRVAALETELAQMRQLLSVFVQKKTPWWLKVAGSFENDPTFDEANRLGQEWRKSAE